MKLIKLKMRIVKHQRELDNSILSIDSCWLVLRFRTTSTSFGVSWTSCFPTFSVQLRTLTSGLILEASQIRIFQTRKKKSKIIRWSNNCTKSWGPSCFEESRERWKRTFYPRLKCTSTLVSLRHRNPFIDNFWRNLPSIKELHLVTIKIFWFS